MTNSIQTETFQRNAHQAPIARRALHDEVIHRLRNLIVEGELPPGARIPERELCERFGISRTPLREALKVLAAEGFVDLHFNRGAVVSRLTLEAVDDMFQVMGALEGLAGESACLRASAEDIVAIEGLHSKMLIQYERHELSEYFRLNQLIHESIIEAAGNPILKNIYHGLSVRIRRARYMANLSRPRWDQAVAEHEKILEALRARDGKRLSRLLKEHLLHKADVVKAFLLAGN